MPTQVVTKRSLKARSEYIGRGFQDVDVDFGVLEEKSRAFMERRRETDLCEGCGNPGVDFYRRSDVRRNDMAWVLRTPIWKIKVILKSMVPLCAVCAGGWQPKTSERKRKLSKNEFMFRLTRTRALREKNPVKRGKLFAASYKWESLWEKEKADAGD